jgi:hypothetical protein
LKYNKRTEPPAGKASLLGKEALGRLFGLVAAHPPEEYAKKHDCHHYSKKSHNECGVAIVAT